MNISIRTDAIKALANFVNPKERREYLRGIVIDIKADKTEYSATNGCVLGIYQTRTITEDVEIKVLIPVDVVKSLKSDLCDLEISDKIFMISGRSRFELMNIEKEYADFPDFKKAFPETVSGKPALFNAEYLTAFIKCAKYLKRKALGTDIYIHFNGETSASPVDIGVEGFYGLIMPYRLPPKEYRNPFVKVAK